MESDETTNTAESTEPKTRIIKEVPEHLKPYKSVFHTLLQCLIDHPEHKVKSIMSKVNDLARMKKRVRTITSYISAEDKTVVGVKCGYFLRWMPTVGDEAVKFGEKKGSSSGLNTMCSDGLAQWSKQQSAARKAVQNITERILLDEADENFLALSDVKEEKANIETARSAVADSELGFETKEELVEYLEENDIALLVA